MREVGGGWIERVGRSEGEGGLRWKKKEGNETRRNCEVSKLFALRQTKAGAIESRFGWGRSSRADDMMLVWGALGRMAGAKGHSTPHVYTVHLTR